MKKVYALGVMQIDTSPNANRTIKSDHLAGLYAHFEEAERAVLENRGDMFEYYYNYALIEETYVIDPIDPPKEGEHLDTPREWWYFADHSKSSEDNDFNPEISACQKPKCLENLVYFWIG